MTDDSFPTCNACGAILPPAADVGRPRVWCSDDCRKRLKVMRERALIRERQRRRHIADQRTYDAFARRR